METLFELEIDNPRYGHSDTYTFDMSRDRMEIREGPRASVCTWQEGQDPLWESESLREILENDMIYPPAIFQSLVQCAWKSWRNGELDSNSVRDEIQALVEWLNIITENKPRSDYWRNIF